MSKKGQFGPTIEKPGFLKSPVFSSNAQRSAPTSLEGVWEIVFVEYCVAGSKHLCEEGLGISK